MLLPSWYPSEASPIAGVFIREQAELLARRYAVQVVVPGVCGWREYLGGAGALRVEQQGEVVVYRQNVPTLVPRLSSLHPPSYLLAARRLVATAAARCGPPDVIHAHVVLPAGWAASRLKRDYSCPTVLTEHSSPLVHLRSAAKRRAVRLALGRLDAVVAVGPGLGQRLRELSPGLEPRIIGDLVRAELFTPARRPPGLAQAGAGSFHLLTVALLTRQKGVDHLLEALALLRTRGHTELSLVVGGDGPCRPALEARAADLGLSGQCRFTGMLTREQVLAEMRCCDLFVLASLNETFGIVLGEAGACGKPVVATRTDGASFVVTPETGVLVDLASPPALASAIEKFVTGSARLDPGVTRQSVVTRFGEDAFLRKWEALYEELWQRPEAVRRAGQGR